MGHMLSVMCVCCSYEKIQKENCQSYFSAVGRADFSVLSHSLDKKTILFNDAKDCLGISGVSLTSYQVEVLGNMACTLDSSYIQNSHPLMLEKLKNCGDLSDSQITAVQSLLLSGNTAYGNPSTWNEQTVEQIGILAVYFKSDLCNTLSFNVRRKFFSVLRKQKIPMKKLRTFFTECNSESATVSNITAVTIADASFPFGFNSTQFDLYLDIAVLQNNLAAITEKVVDTSLQTVILNKLNQIYPSGLTDGVLQLLGSASRVATIDDISKWNITIIDTLSSLIDSNDGLWEPEKSKAVIMRYLSMGNRSLGSAEINAVGSNICTLNISVLENINAESLKEVLFPDLSSCTTEQKSALYITANTSFSNQRSNAKTYYQIMRPYLGGAPVEDIQALSTQNISMDITIFISLDPAVLKILNVSTVRDLMGVNIADLKLFENSSVVQSWVSRQNQSDLNTLNLGIINHNPCYGVDSHPLDSEFASGNVSAVLCNFSIPAYACSSVVVLSSDDLATLLTCKLPSSLNYSKGAWKLFFQNFPGPLDDVLDRFSNMTHSSIRPDPNILDAIWEVIIKDFTAAQLMNATFITEWFQMRLRPFLSSVSTDFLSSLSSKSFSCESYQAVVEALSSQESLMKEEQKQLVFTSFIFPFLSRVDLPDPGCRSNTSGSNKWLEKNLGNFSNYAPLEKLKILNANFSSVAVLGLLSSEQKAQFILQPDSGVLGNDSVFREVFSSAITSLDRNQLGSFLTVFHQTAIQVRISVVYKPGHISFRNKTRLFYAY
ncbi:mesothelin-like protein [Pangasianodon hypophthalmus]|uniref:mesothelin-like protein n=1 Tax=Pangasianodon hypophthalmus TaxID=310915 RepID=UPI002307126C|nr:mesothelin-like protein [Pangasianodon hypophthalmus]